MIYFRLPTSTANYHYTQTVELSGVNYMLEIRYNTRMGRWILSLLNTVGQPIVQGIPMLALRDLVGQYTSLSVPTGQLVCYNSSSPFTDPTLTSFSTNTQFLYIEPS